ncbi:conserved hypothetical protein [Ricinus communis]|uniref:Uncharacterized protein n=1 Tax=Ricinus communis TaxID=3988 RepID=B9T4K6_RICCO|nr:conserved hypothetical protein [Ricinus communis]
MPATPFLPSPLLLPSPSPTTSSSSASLFPGDASSLFPCTFFSGHFSLCRLPFLAYRGLPRRRQPVAVIRAASSHRGGAARKEEVSSPAAAAEAASCHASFH